MDVQGQVHLLCFLLLWPYSALECSYMLQPTPNREHRPGTALLASTSWDNIHLPAWALQKTFTLLTSHLMQFNQQVFGSYMKIQIGNSLLDLDLYHLR